MSLPPAIATYLYGSGLPIACCHVYRVGTIFPPGHPGQHWRPALPAAAPPRLHLLEQHGACRAAAECSARLQAFT